MALSEAQLAQLWIKAGGNPNYAVVMAKIAKRESGGNPAAQNLNAATRDHSIGLWQINQLAHKGRYGSDQALMDPLANARAAVAIFKSAKSAWGDPLKPWSTRNPAIDNKYIGAAVPVGAPVPGGGKKRTVTKTVPGVDRSGERAQLIANYLSNQHDPNALIQLAGGLPQTKDTPARKITKTTQAEAPKFDPVPGGSGSFKITGPNPGRLTKPLVSFAKKVAAVYGQTLTGSDGSGHSKYTVDGNVSDHWSGNATDIPATGKTLLAMGRAALIAAGMPRSQAMKANGGLYNINGHQVIFLTNQGGNHYDHLHISV